MRPTQKIAYAFFAQTVLLVMLYAAAALLGAVKFLSPADPLALALPYHQIGGLTNVLLLLAGLTGLLGGGLYAAGEGDRAVNEMLLGYAFRLWTALLILAVAAGLLGLLEGRHLLELPPVLDALQIVTLALVLVAVGSRAPRTPVIQVWMIGLGLSVVGTIIGLLPPGDYRQDRALRVLSTGLTLNIAHPLMAAAVGFWLMRRFSNVTEEWADTGVYSVAGMVTLAGALVSLTPLVALGETAPVLGNIAVFAVPVLYAIFAAHAYRALADRSHSRTLSAHWFALALALFLLGMGLLGALQAAPGVGVWTLGTRLTDLQITLTALAPAAMSLGAANQAAAELRGQNRRVTGLTPFWLVSFGLIGGALALGAAGVAQALTERRLGLGYLDVQALVEPLYALWVVGLLLVALGAAIYALTFWLRRPEIRSS
ncbi:MAG: hypothetical protein BroJett038_21140 [Chloroflexota bacterium]|nr:MAG: hypothetical protein BroJett038_21140 [Chloroflexota bacterium]